MKPVSILWFCSLMLAGQSLAQMTLPPPPGYPGKARTTGGGQGGVGLAPKDPNQRKTQYTTRIMLSDSRNWTSTDGKLIEGRLIAYEDLVVEAPKNAAPPPPPKAPEKPTVMRNENVRIQLANRKIVEIPLARLSEGDREFVARIQTAHHGKAAPR